MRRMLRETVLAAVTSVPPRLVLRRPEPYSELSAAMCRSRVSMCTGLTSQVTTSTCRTVRSGSPPRKPSVHIGMPLSRGSDERRSGAPFTTRHGQVLCTVVEPPHDSPS